MPFAAPVPTRTIALAHRTDVHPTRAVEEFRATLVHLLGDAHARDDLPAGVRFIRPAVPKGSQSGAGSTSVGQPPVPSSSRTTRNASPSE